MLLQPSFGPSNQAQNTFITEHLAQAELRHNRIQFLEDQITELAAHINAATFRFLELIREYDECKGWEGGGLISLAHWLNWKCGIGLGAAREKVRVAHALKALPLISQSFREGRVSFSKVRAMTRVATPNNEEYLMNIARYGTAVHVERVVRGYRSVKRTEALAQENSRHAQRELHWYIDDEGYWVIQGRLPAEQGALLQKALERVMDEQFHEQQDVPARTSGGDPSSEVQARPEPIAGRRADALARLAQSSLSPSSSSAGGSCGDRFLVHVHTDMETLKANGSGGQAELEAGGTIAAETARRLCCDASVVHWLQDPDGEALNIGRKSRTVPPAMRRALQRRDGGCCFPGCSCTRFVDAHHIQHWADGGETSMDNLVLLCRRHHRLVHEVGFGLRKAVSGRFEFTRPDGVVIPRGPDTRSRGNVLALFETHAQSGINITPKSIQSLWCGERMDDDLAVLGMLRREF